MTEGPPGAPRRPIAVRAKRPHRPVVLIILVVAVVVVLGATVLISSRQHSGAGYAATVNGTVISQTTLNLDLANVASNSLFETAMEQQGPPGPVEGKRKGTYNKVFVDYMLSQDIRLEVLRQRLAASHLSPTAAQLATGKAEVLQNDVNSLVPGFPPRYQSELFAHQAETDVFVNLATAKLPAATINQYYQAHQSDYATEWCVQDILIADGGPGGGLDKATSLAGAQAVRAQLAAGADFGALAAQYSNDNDNLGGGDPVENGQLSGSDDDGCLDVDDVQQLPPPFPEEVAALPVGQVSQPQATQYGYFLIEVTSRMIEPLDASVTEEIDQKLAADQLTQLEAHADVKANPKYGTFDNKVSPSTGELVGVVS